MKLGYIGLGKMGFNMVERLLEKSYHVIAFDRSPSAAEEAAGKGAQRADTPASMVSSPSQARLVWVMVPHQAVDAVLRELVPPLAKGEAAPASLSSAEGRSPSRDSKGSSRTLRLPMATAIGAGPSPATS